MAEGLDQEQKKSIRTFQWPSDESGFIVRTDGKQYTPTTGQGIFHNDPAAIRLLVGGRGSGKTAAGTQEAQKKIAAGEPGLIIAPNMEHFKISTWPQFNEWIPVDPAITGLPQSPLVEHWSKGDRMIRFKTGSVVWYGGIKDPDSWRGPNVNWVWYDEPGRHPYRTSFLVPIGAMRVGTDIKMWLTTTPRGVMHWLYTYFVKKDLGDEVMRALEEAGFDPDPSVLLSWVRSSTYENRENLNPLYFAMLLATYKGKWRDQELEGKFISFEGLVYDVFDPGVHIIDRRDFHMESWWPVWRVIDFGYKNPFVCQWWTRNPDGDYFRFKELYMTERTVNAHSEQINAESQNMNIIDTICDWDAEDRATLEEHGIDTIPARKGIQIGIQLVYRMLSFDESKTPDVYFVRDSLIERDSMLAAREEPVCTEDEFPRYSWPQDREGKVRKENPIDLFNHGMDCLLYFLLTVEGVDEFGLEMGGNPLAGYRG